MTQPPRRSTFCLAFGLALALAPTLLGAQSVTRWQVSWKSAAYRYVNGAQVPVGTESTTLTVTATGPGDSVVVIMPTANPAVTDTLAGVRVGARISAQSGPRSGNVIARPMSGQPPAPEIAVTTILQLDIQGDSVSGTLTRLITGVPGATVPPSVSQVSGSRVP